ncbi:MAG: type II toxin-antitoxin system VapB family antitoxin [Verrucomicrobiota bacterium]
MQLNIKNPEAYELASRLSDLTGESLTKAVMNALSERLERTKRDKVESQKGIADQLLAFSEKARQKHELYDDRNHAEMLYDGDGLPKTR